jgi:hypothetical protein
MSLPLMFTGPTLVANAGPTHGSGSAATTSGVDTTGSNLCLVVSYAYLGGNPTIATISDSKSNTWTNLTMRGGGLDADVLLSYVSNPTVGASHTFTTTFTAPSFAPVISAACFSGVATSTPFDVENGATSSATSLQTGSITPSVNGELLISAISKCCTSQTWTIDNSFSTINSDFSAGDGEAVTYKVQSAAAAINPTWTSGGVSESVSVMIAAFKPSGGSAFPSAIINAPIRCCRVPR